MDSPCKVRLSITDQRAILAAYKLYLGGKPVEALGLNDYQLEIFEVLAKLVTSGKTGTQISQETGINVSFCCDMKEARNRFRRYSKDAKSYYTKTGREALNAIHREYGTKVDAPRNKTPSEVYRMILNRQRVSHVQGISGIIIGKVKRFQEMQKNGASVSEISLTTGISENEVRKMIRIKKEKEQLRKTL